MNPELLYREHIAELRARHARALDNSGFDCVLIHAGAPATPFLDDNDYPFRVSPHFKHWLPLLEHPYCVIVVRADERPTLIYFQPEDYWHKPPADPEGHWVSEFDIVLATSPEQIAAALPAQRTRTAYIGDRAELLGQFDSAQVNPPGLLAELHFLRAYKTDYEIHCLREANLIAARGHLAAERAFFGGGSELDIHHAYLRGAGVLECELPYTNIVAMNEHSSILHYHGADRAPMQTGDIRSLVIDAGADYCGYASDITRSYAYRDGEYAELLAALDAEQCALVDEVKAGVDFADLHWSGHLGVARLLSRFEFVRMEPEDIVERDISRVFFPCGVGHFIGLQVHDVGGYLRNPAGEELPRDPRAPFLRLARPVEPRQALTIEPGIYFMDMLLSELRRSPDSQYINWDKVETFRPYGGVRVEDCLVVREDGVENQSRDAFRAVAGEQ